MSKKRKSTGKRNSFFFIVLLVIVGFIYWLYISPTSEQNIPSETDKQNESMTEENDPILSLEDSSGLDNNIILPDTNTIVEVVDTLKNMNESKLTKEVHTQDAFVDEFGNVIYTHPEKSQEIRYKTHSQGRWGYSFKYPSSLSQSSQSQNNDGSVFENKKGVKLTSYGSWNVFNESISELYQKDVPGARSVTYKKLFRKQKNYVKSGYTKDNQIYYMKEAIIGKDNQEVVVTLVLTYPKSYNQAEQIIKEIFPIFPIINR